MRWRSCVLQAFATSVIPKACSPVQRWENTFGSPTKHLQSAQIPRFITTRMAAMLNALQALASSTVKRDVIMLWFVVHLQAAQAPVASRKLSLIACNSKQLNRWKAILLNIASQAVATSMETNLTMTSCCHLGVQLMCQQ